jgi:hypothetical protein
LIRDVDEPFVRPESAFRIELARLADRHYLPCAFRFGTSMEDPAVEERITDFELEIRVESIILADNGLKSNNGSLARLATDRAVNPASPSSSTAA